jgi:hypothetical protein
VSLGELLTVARLYGAAWACASLPCHKSHFTLATKQQTIRNKATHPTKQARIKSSLPRGKMASTHPTIRIVYRRNQSLTVATNDTEIARLAGSKLIPSILTSIEYLGNAFANNGI